MKLRVFVIGEDRREAEAEAEEARVGREGHLLPQETITASSTITNIL